MLRLADREGGRIGVPLGLLEASPRGWALVYLGIAHAAARGADLDVRTRELLRLP